MALRSDLVSFVETPRLPPRPFKAATFFSRFEAAFLFKMIADPHKQQISPLRCAPVEMTVFWVGWKRTDNGKSEMRGSLRQAQGRLLHSAFGSGRDDAFFGGCRESSFGRDDAKNDRLRVG